MLLQHDRLGTHRSLSHRPRVYLEPRAQWVGRGWMDELKVATPNLLFTFEHVREVLT